MERFSASLRSHFARCGLHKAMRFCLDLPDGRLEYGWDEVLSFYGTRFDERGREVDHHDALTIGYDHGRPLHSLLIWMAQRLDLFDETDVEAGCEWLLQQDGHAPPDHLTTLVEVLDNLRVAAECR